MFKNEFLYMAVTIFTLTFAIRASNNMLITTVPLISAYVFHFSSVLIGIVSSMLSISTFISSFFINSRLDSSKRRSLFLISSAIYALTFPLFFIANEILILPLSFLAGFSLGFLFPNIITLSSSFNDRRKSEQMLALYTTALSLSLIISPGLESLILQRFTLRQAFLFFSLLAFLVLAISLTIKFPESHRKRKVNSKAKEIIFSPKFLSPFFNNLMYDIPFAFIEVFGGIYAIDYFHASYSMATLLFTLYFLTSFIGRALFTLAAPSNIFRIIILNVVLSITGLFLAFISFSISLYIISLLILGIPHGLTYPSSLIIIERNFADDERSAANSYFTGILIGLGGVVPMIMGGVVSLIGIRKSFLLLTMVVLAFFIMFFIKQREIKNKEPSSSYP
ncbi:MFS transporter [Acidianus sp. HS-5]|uniref:MFS transporter n=1 Tax=Acidianus sp. HS-5 TaxID=2886040 RepID=UPI001F00144B|nr:MFS transporter [Acidianus sp. HS-5]BDC19543.1 MFS transporter [Acidianus sp. HS-5]